MCSLKRTPLYSLHAEHGAKFVPFAGYEMPVQYALGVKREHEHTRAACGLFDVSHMGQLLLRGGNAAGALEALAPGDFIGLEQGAQRYAFFTSPEGGIYDDLMVANPGDDQLYLVVNAACKQRDLALLRTGLEPSVEIAVLDDRALLALQGPKAQAVMARVCPQATRLVFMQHARFDYEGETLWISRSGYTGEDGFEISLAAASAEAFARRLLAEPEVEPIGLGARDSLRLEAGLCLYGHDIDEHTDPVSAALIWALAKCRRQGGEREGGFPGAGLILPRLAERDQLERRVGLLGEGRAPVREGTALFDGEGHQAGRVTSGTFGPSVGRPVAMGYVRVEEAALGTKLYAEVRGKRLPMTVVELPFVPARYHRG